MMLIVIILIASLIVILAAQVVRAKEIFPSNSYLHEDSFENFIDILDSLRSVRHSQDMDDFEEFLYNFVNETNLKRKRPDEIRSIIWEEFNSYGVSKTDLPSILAELSHLRSIEGSIDDYDDYRKRRQYKSRLASSTS